MAYQSFTQQAMAEPYGSIQKQGQRQQVYGQRQNVYGQPQQIYGLPQQVYNQPQQVYSLPQEVYSQPQQVYNQPQQVYNQPQQVYNQPQQVYSLPQQVHSQARHVSDQPQQASGQPDDDLSQFINWENCAPESAEDIVQPPNQIQHQVQQPAVNYNFTAFGPSHGPIHSVDDNGTHGFLPTMPTYRAPPIFYPPVAPIPVAQTFNSLERNVMHIARDDCVANTVPLPVQGLNSIVKDNLADSSKSNGFFGAGSQQVAFNNIDNTFGSPEISQTPKPQPPPSKKRKRRQQKPSAFSAQRVDFDNIDDLFGLSDIPQTPKPQSSHTKKRKRRQQEPSASSAQQPAINNIDDLLEPVYIAQTPEPPSSATSEEKSQEEGSPAGDRTFSRRQVRTGACEACKKTHIRCVHTQMTNADARTSDATLKSLGELIADSQEIVEKLQQLRHLIDPQSAPITTGAALEARTHLRNHQLDVSSIIAIVERAWPMWNQSFPALAVPEQLGNAITEFNLVRDKKWKLVEMRKVRADLSEWKEPYIRGFVAELRSLANQSEAVDVEQAQLWEVAGHSVAPVVAEVGQAQPSNLEGEMTLGGDVLDDLEMMRFQELSQYVYGEDGRDH